MYLLYGSIQKVHLNKSESKPTAGRPAVVHYDETGERAEEQFIWGRALDEPTPLLLTAMGKAETAAVFGESKMLQYIAEIVRKDPVTFTHPWPEQDVLFELNYDHTTIESEGYGFSHCNPDRIWPRQPRETQDSIVHYDLIASGDHLMRHEATRDQLSHKQGVLCFETETTSLKYAAQYLVIRGICDYADSHSSKLWHAYAAVAAAAYAKEDLSFIPKVSKTTPLWQQTPRPRRSSMLCS
ncbi:NACHT domain protein [Aspergillus sclerotialis]|uniref:NACHT domain protein n=1 Tax=Aspergillus sclerotialis TaxID=2070753 RepID=A0A3A2ZLF0_9EURO|nr:NACHT domain protein [Aspergillus sclerotialis]